MKLRLLAATAWFAAQMASAQTASSTADPVITGKDTRAHVAFLASDEMRGRNTGDEYLEIAAQYLATRFESYGLKPAGSSWFQDFGLYRRGFSDASRVAFETAQGRIDLAWGSDAVALPGSISGSFDAEVVFAGYGISTTRYDDYAGLDVQGKVVLVFRYAPEFAGNMRQQAWFARKIEVAQSKGAVGLILVTGNQGDGEDQFSAMDGGYDGFSEPPAGPEVGIPAIHLSRASAKRLGQAIGVDILTLENKITENKAPQSGPLAGFRAQAKLQSAGIKTEVRNVLGVLPGSDLAHEYVVIGAHYDHVGDHGDGRDTIHNGADDNASGTACLLEVARALAARGGLRRTIVFIGFTAEEQGLWGSRYYVENPAFPLENTIAMINLDMVGRNAAMECEVLGAVQSPAMRAILDAANVEGMKLRYSQDVGGGSSDHAPFEAKKIPYLFFFSGFHDDYHQPSDHVEKIDAEKIARIGRLCYRVVEDLADTTTPPARLGRRSYY